MLSNYSKGNDDQPKLIQQAQPYWKQYVEHEFVQQLAKGTLPKACFQHYLKQDYIYLFHYSRAFALGLFKARNLPNGHAT